MANSLDQDQIGMTQAMNNYFRYGIPIPDHLKPQVAEMNMIQGTEKPKDQPLGRNLQWNRPFYNKGGKAHTGDGNPMHGTMTNRAHV